MRKTIFYKIYCISLATAFVLSSCTVAATPMASIRATATPLASPDPEVPTTTVPVGPSATDTPATVSTDTPAATLPAAPTAELTPQVNPGMNAYCRKGPGTYYFAVTFLQAGNNYTVIGRDGLDTWWLVQVTPNVSCWMGDPTTVTQGPVEQAPVLPAPPLPSSASSFVNTSHCDPVQNTLTVWLTWTAAQGATGYNIYRNGSLIASPGPKDISYTDNAPRGVDLKYQIEPFNAYGVGPRQTTRVSACI